MSINDQCPKCGYPDTFNGMHYKGIYEPGEPCDNCRFIEEPKTDNRQMMRVALATYAHLAWSEWMEYLFKKSIDNGDGSVIIPAKMVERWRRQMNTDYSQLTEEEKQSDLKEADRILKIIE